MFTEFKIKELTSWADIELSCGKRKLEFSASKAGFYSFEELAEGLLLLKKKENISTTVTFDLESKGLLYLIFSSYPNTLIKLSVYIDIFWGNYEETFEDQPMPKPVFESIIPELGYFISSVVTEFEKYGKQGFASWSNEFFNEKLEELKH